MKCLACCLASVSFGFEEHGSDLSGSGCRLLMPSPEYKRRAKSLVNQKATCFVVLLLLKQNSLHIAAPTQNASACRNMQFQPGGLFTPGGSGRRWVARRITAALDRKTGGSVYSLPPFIFFL